MYKVGIIGMGVVGKGIESLLKDYVVSRYDPVRYSQEIEFKIEGFQKEDFRGLDLAVICVPTPTADDGVSCDTSIVFQSLLWLEDINFDGVVMIKSTVEPNSLSSFVARFKDLKIVFSPEFMGESKYPTPSWNYPDPTDMRFHTWQTFGGNEDDTSKCVDIFKTRMSVDTRFFQVDHITACLAKYIENSFFALKVTFCNEWYDIAQSFGVNWNTLRECWLADPRINRNHTLVFPENRGYGGKCFPKDVKGIIAAASEKGYESKLMKSVDSVNDDMRKKNV